MSTGQVLCLTSRARSEAIFFTLFSMQGGGRPCVGTPQPGIFVVLWGCKLVSKHRDCVPQCGDGMLLVHWHAQKQSFATTRGSFDRDANATLVAIVGSRVDMAKPGGERWGAVSLVNVAVNRRCERGGQRPASQRSAEQCARRSGCE
jgi:hypothetical protein